MNAPAKPARPAPESRDGYRAFRTITTRWMDNDMYGHVNNVVYYIHSFPTRRSSD